MLKLFLLTLGLFVSVQAVPSGNMLKLSEANDDFGLQLLQKLESVELAKSNWKTRSNVFISPFSVGTVLTMLLAGGQHQTYDQIYSSLGFSKTKLAKSELFTGYKQVIDSLNSHQPASTVLNIANAIAVQKQFPLVQDFLNNITTNFESQVFAEDFTKQSAVATKQINDWVSTKTHGKIQKLFDQDLPASTAIVLLNAIYFKGNWKFQFKKEKTQPNFWFNPDDQSDQKPTAYLMSMKTEFNYAEFADGQLIELPYQNETLSMFVFLPPQGASASISSLLTGANNLETRIGKLQQKIVQLDLPKFKLEKTYQLAATLQQMGILDAFGPKADFSGIDNNRDLYVSQVVHKTFVEVNEEGAEAAAATGVIMPPSASIDPPKEIFFRADHPFLFAIRDKATQVTLFAGIINSPGKSS